jgi:hypothetical protein
MIRLGKQLVIQHLGQPGTRPRFRKGGFASFWQRRPVVGLPVLRDEEPGWRRDHLEHNHWGCQVSFREDTR